MVGLYKRIATILLIAGTCIAAPAVQAGFKIDIKRDMQGLQVLADVSSIDAGHTTILKLSNHDEVPVNCRVTFDSRMNQSKSYKRKIAPGSTASLSHSAGRRPTRVIVKIACHAE